MHLNTIQPGDGARRKKVRVGRGIGSGAGKTCRRGHKGARSRTGATRGGRKGFEGGQMPLIRRVPKFGFISRKSLVREEITLSDLNTMVAEQIDLATLRAEGVVRKSTKYVKVVLSGALSRAVTLVDIKATKGAKAAIEAAGGTVTMTDAGND